MFDNVRLKVYDLPKNYSLFDYDKIKCRINPYKGNLKNMVIWRNPDCVIIFGSLAKYLHDENITPLTREEVKQAIKKLENDTGLCLKNAVVCSVEFGISVRVKEKPFEYMNLFGYTNRLARHVFVNGNINRTYRREVSSRKGVETVLYTTPKGSFEFIVYDKIKEMFTRNKKIPSSFEGYNVLRLEYKIRKRRGIQAKFEGDLTAYRLFDDENVYSIYKKLFWNKYNSIGKMGRLLNADELTETTPAKIKKTMAEQYRQNHPEEYHHHLQRFIEAGKLSPKSLEQIRTENNKLENDINVSESNPLIKELDALVYDRVMFGA